MFLPRVTFRHNWYEAAEYLITCGHAEHTKEIIYAYLLLAWTARRSRMRSRSCNMKFIAPDNVQAPRPALAPPEDGAPSCCRRGWP